MLRVCSDMILRNLLRNTIYLCSLSQDVLWKKSINHVNNNNHYYHLHTNFRIFVNFDASIPLVKMSDFCRRVLILTRVTTLPYPQLCLKKWYFTPMCFVLGVIFKVLSVVRAPLLSSKTADLITILLSPPSFITINITKSKRCIGTSSPVAWLRAIYSALVVLSEISV